MKFHLVGGPYDGAEGPPFPLFDGAEELYVSHDPKQRGPFGLIASLSRKPGFERYDWFKREGGMDFYVHDCLPEDMIFAGLRKFERPPMDPVQMWEQLRREIPDWEESR